jgi:hypothetical protein
LYLFIRGKMKTLYRICFAMFLISVLSFPGRAQSTLFNRTDEPGYGCGDLEGGYASDLSGYRGDTLKFYISTHALNYDLKIYRYGRTKELVATIPNVKGGIHRVMEDDAVYLHGCNWPEAARIVIPGNWKPGAYLAEFPALSDTINPVLFFVKDANTTNRLLVVCATNTYQAYNMFGGKSTYTFNSSYGGPGISDNRSDKLSFFRPFNRNHHSQVNRGSFAAYDSKLIKWLEEEGYDADVVSETDLDRDPSYLMKHKVLLITGHSEYWSRNMRDNVEAFLNNGNHFMCLSGNTCWWQIRYEDNYHTFVCYKHNLEDPFYGKEQGTQEWYTIKRENPFLGTSYQHGGQVNYTGCLPWTKGYGGYIVRNSQHWAFDNTGLSEGDTLGYYADSSIVGYETDAALFKYRNGMPLPTGSDQTPLNFTLLGLSPADFQSENLGNEWSTMGIFKYNRDKNPNAGYVFNAATVRWAWGLQSHTTKVSLMTKNILEHFLKDNFPPRFTSWWPFTAGSEVCLQKKMPFNYRKIKLQQGKRISFRVSAVDENNGHVSYYWTVNDTLVPENGSVLKFNSSEHPLGLNSVRAYSFNSKDTASISWEVNVMAAGKDIKIAAGPEPTFSTGKLFSYSPLVEGNTAANVHYRIDHIPDWMSYDPEENKFEGTPDIDAPQEDSICVAAVDNLGNMDFETFKIHSLAELSVMEENTRPADFELLQNYPNPFNGMTKIRFYAKSTAVAELVITNLKGQNVRSFKLGQVNPGFHDVSWDGRNENRVPVSSGVYLYKLNCVPAQGPGYSIVKKMSYIK